MKKRTYFIGRYDAFTGSMPVAVGARYVIGYEVPPGFEVMEDLTLDYVRGFNLAIRMSGSGSIKNGLPDKINGQFRCYIKREKIQPLPRADLEWTSLDELLEAGK